MVQSVPSPSKMLMRGVSLLIFLAHWGLAGGINKPEQKSPAGTMNVLGLWSQLSYWLHRKVCAGGVKMGGGGGGGGRLLHPSVTWVKNYCRKRNFICCKHGAQKELLTEIWTRREKSASHAMLEARQISANCCAKRKECLWMSVPVRYDISYLHMQLSGR